MTDERQLVELPANQVTMKRGFPVYRTNPSVPSASELPTRSKRFHVPGGKASMIVDNSTGEIKGIGGMGFWWEEEVDTTRFVKLFLDGIKQAAGLSKTGIQVFELIYHQMRANPGSDEIKLNRYVANSIGKSETWLMASGSKLSTRRNLSASVRRDPVNLSLLTSSSYTLSVQPPNVGKFTIVTGFQLSSPQDISLMRIPHIYRDSK